MKKVMKANGGGLRIRAALAGLGGLAARVLWGAHDFALYTLRPVLTHIAAFALGMGVGIVLGLIIVVHSALF